MPSSAEYLGQVYDELRSLAAAKIAGERPGITLNATALVHEAYMRMGGDQSFEGKGHFFASAAEAMRRILVEAARRRQRLKRGGDGQKVEAELDCFAAPDRDEEIIALHEVLELLAAVDPTKAELVKLRYFAGLTSDEAAALMGISPSNADRQWKYARAWLKRAMTPAPE